MNPLKIALPRILIFWVIVFMAISHTSLSQTTIWSENFDSYTDGTISGSGTGVSPTPWYSQLGAEVNSMELLARNTLNTGSSTITNPLTWQTDPINIVGYETEFTIDVEAVGSFEDSGSFKDYFKLEYRIDGTSGSWIPIVEASGSSSNPIQSDYTITDIIGSTIEIRSSFHNTGGDESYTLDNIIISGQTLIDSDADGVFDIVDLDDDNDGITDAVENGCGPNVNGYDAYWPLENLFDDQSGNSHNLQAGSASFSSTSIRGSHSAEFNGTSDYLRYDDGTFLNQAVTNFSYAFWVKPNTFSGIQTLLDEGGGTNGIAIRLNGTTLENAVREGGASSQVSTSDFTFPNDGIWHHVAITYANGTVVMYLDGMASSILNTGFGALAPHGSGHAFGRSDGDAFGQGVGNYYDGLMDEIIHYPIALSQSEVIALMAGCDTDNDDNIDALEADSDADGCGDADEAYGDASADSDDNGKFGTGNPTVDSQGLVQGASYQLPADNNGNAQYDFQEAVANVNPVPPNDVTISGGSNAFFTTDNLSDVSYQWQLFDGLSWNDLSDGGIYSGALTPQLTLVRPNISLSNGQYRVIVTNDILVCDTFISSAALLKIVPRIITNRRITYRVKGN